MKQTRNSEESRPNYEGLEVLLALLFMLLLACDLSAFLDRKPDKDQA